MLNQMNRYINRFLGARIPRPEIYKSKIVKLNQDLYGCPTSQLTTVFREIGKTSTKIKLLQNIQEINKKSDKFHDIMTDNHPQYRDNIQQLLQGINDVLDYPGAVDLLKDKVALMESYGHLILLGETKYIQLFIDTINETIAVINRLKRTSCRLRFTTL